MGIRYLATVALLANLAAGCAPIYPVQIAPLGSDTYIATQASASSWLDARAVALQRAADWCAKRGGTFAAGDAQQQRAALGIVANDHASVTFTCTGTGK